MRKREHACATLTQPCTQGNRAVVDAAALEATALQHQLAAAEDAEILAKFNPQDNDVISLTAEEHAAFVSAVQPVLAKYRKELGPKLFSYLE